MDNGLSDIILKFQRSKECEERNAAYEIVFQKFEPLLKKYAHLLRDTDAKNDLMVTLFLAMLKMPLHIDRFKDDKYVVSYISKSINYAYIAMSKNNKKREMIKNIDDCLELGYGTDVCDNILYNQLISDINEILTKKERHYFELRFIKDYSDVEIAAICNVSRQAVNKKINLIKRKIRSLLIGQESQNGN